VTRIAVIAVSELVFQSRIEGAVRALGFDTAVADTAPRLDAALASQPEIVVINVQERGFDAGDAIARAKVAGARVLAFGQHTSPAELRAARQAGADLALPRSEIAERLPELIERLLRNEDVAESASPAPDGGL
jgi:DNA-binding NarL/FixJ family response regulator